MAPRALPGSVYMAGSGEPTVLRALVARAIKDTPRPRVAVSYAAVAGSHQGLSHMQRTLGSLFAGAPGARVSRFSVAGESDAMPDAEARRIVEEADIVFLSGGDPALGAKTLDAAGASEWLRAARARGASMMGISAGSIMLGAWWAEWDEQDVGALVACSGVASDLVVDCHDEDSDWEELRQVERLLTAREGAGPIALYGIPAGGALVVDAGDAITSEGKPPFVLRARSQ